MRRIHHHVRHDAHQDAQQRVTQFRPAHGDGYATGQKQSEHHCVEQRIVIGDDQRPARSERRRVAFDAHPEQRLETKSKKPADHNDLFAIVQPILNC